ncbi:MAG: hypothetical protein ACR2QL_01215, partial [Woeseiaceae bacterium]
IMTTRKYLVLLTLSLAFVFGSSHAQESDDPAATDSATPREQRPDRAHKKPRRENMTAEQRAAARERWQNMSQEERQAKREQMRARHGGKERQHRRSEGGQRPEGGRPPKAGPDEV